MRKDRELIPGIKIKEKMDVCLENGEGMALPLPQKDKEICQEEMRHFRALRGERGEKIEEIFSPGKRIMANNKNQGKD